MCIIVGVLRYNSTFIYFYIFPQNECKFLHMLFAPIAPLSRRVLCESLLLAVCNETLFRVLIAKVICTSLNSISPIFCLKDLSRSVTYLWKRISNREPNCFVFQELSGKKMMQKIYQLYWFIVIKIILLCEIIILYRQYIFTWWETKTAWRMKK